MNAVRTRPAASALAAAVSCALAVIAAGCGGGTTGGAATTGLASAPPVTLEGCTYVYNSSIPNGEPMGVPPGFASFTPDSSADQALQQIKAHGGSAMVDSLIVPSGITLYAGPDTSQRVGTVGEGDSILVAEPVVYRDHSGGTWLAFFLSCGGPNLYWLSLDHAKHQDAAFAGGVETQLQQDRQAAPYTRTGQASLLPVTINEKHHLVFAAPTVKFEVGRGEVYGGA